MRNDITDAIELASNADFYSKRMDEARDSTVLSLLNSLEDGASIENSLQSARYKDFWDKDMNDARDVTIDTVARALGITLKQDDPVLSKKPTETSASCYNMATGFYLTNSASAYHTASGYAAP